MIFTSFFTRNTIYEEQVYKLIASLEKFNLPYYIEGIDQFSTNWRDVCGYRGKFIVSVMEKFNDDVCWIDADAIINQYPKELMTTKADLSFYFRNNCEILLGTSLFKNTDEVKKLLLKWSQTIEQNKNKNISQFVFKQLLTSTKLSKHFLPESYCHIFDKPLTTEPVITHYQLSRQKMSDWSIPTLPLYKQLTLKPLARIGLITRLNGWAFENRCQALIKNLSRLFDIKIIEPPDLHKLHKTVDLIYLPTYEVLYKYEKYELPMIANVAGLVVNDFEKSLHLLNPAKGIIVPNCIWYNQYKEKYPKVKLYHITNGVDTDLFLPNNREKKPFTLGWAGNATQPRCFIKRIDEIRQVCKDMNIRLVEKNWKTNYIPHKEMPSFYDEIDAYINLSITEGSNNAILEACSAGKIIIGTNVGNMPRISKIGGYVVNQDLSDLEETINYVRNMEYDKRIEEGLRLRQLMIDEFTWKRISEKYAQAFIGGLQ